MRMFRITLHRGQHIARGVKSRQSCERCPFEHAHSKSLIRRVAYDAHRAQYCESTVSLPHGDVRSGTKQLRFKRR